MPTARRVRDGVHHNWFWIRGRTLGIYPAPTEDTQEKDSGTCTVSGSLVTPDSFSFSKNSLINYLCLVGSSYFIINNNTTAAFTVNGVPSASATTYTIYNRGIQIWYSRIPDFLDEGSDELPGDDMDANIICLRAARDILSMMPKSEERMKSIININAQIKGKYDLIASNKRLKYEAPIVITPFPLRSDAAGYSDISGTTTDDNE
jgi:hypothetical protein